MSKQCPFCKIEIDYNISICPYCKRILREKILFNKSDFDLQQVNNNTINDEKNNIKNQPDSSSKIKIDKVLPFFILWIFSISIFIVSTNTSNDSTIFFDSTMSYLLPGSMIVGSISYLFAISIALKYKKNYYVWSLIIGFFLFFYVLYKMVD